VHARYLFVYFCTGSLSSGTVEGSVGGNNIINELTNGLLVLAMGLKKLHTTESNLTGNKFCAPYLLKVGAIVARGEPGGLSVRDQRNFAMAR
jgi:hypothetical protein